MIEGLYIHVPFCDGKCHYCAFYSVPFTQEKGVAWLEALKREAGAASNELGPFSFSTVFMGGGTPSILPLNQLEGLLDLIRDGLKTRPNRGGAAPCGESEIEWTSEANPGSVDADKLNLMKAAGVNRISLGVQALDDRVLQQLGRRHSLHDIHVAVEAIQTAGFLNWGIDLIACIPGVSVAAWRDTLRAALALEPAHVSVYALTSEEGTRLNHEHRAGKVALLDDDEQLHMLDAAEEILEAAGLNRYEISNYARPGYECRHNLSCWRGGNYLGLGCAASSRVGNRRWTNTPDLDAYLKSFVREEELLKPSVDAVERVVFGLRMSEGIELQAILKACGLAGSSLESDWRGKLTRLAEDDLVVSTCGRWRLTTRGRALADYVAVELMP